MCFQIAICGTQIITQQKCATTKQHDFRCANVFSNMRKRTVQS